MCSTWICALPNLAVFLLIIPSARAADYQPDVNLEDMCGRNVTILCPPVYYKGSAGTVRFNLIPNDNCSVTITLDNECGNAFQAYAIYVNIRTFVLPQSDRIKVSELSANGRWIVHKDLSGSKIGWNRPPSVAQVLTSYSDQPALQIDYTRGSSPSTYIHEAYFDYVLVQKAGLAYNTYCSALSGYVDDNLICDTDGNTDRINCPGNFGPYWSTVTNPAYSRQGCGSTTRGYYWTTTEYPYHYQSNDYGLSDGAVAGISVGVVFLIVFLAGIASAVSSNRRSAARPVTFSSMPGTVSISQPSVVGNYAPRPPPSAGPVPPFMDAPPSYAEVTAPNSNLPFPPAPNSSFAVASDPNTGFPMPSVPKY